MYWLSMPPIFGLTVPWWPCGPIPITLPPNASIAWSIPPSAVTMRAGAVEPRAHRTDRQLESLGHALVREVLPREEQERLALAVRQSLDRIGHTREEQAGIERPGARAPVRRLVSRRHPGTRAQPS